MINVENILTEVPPITGQDSFVIFERHKNRFNFPIHIHKEYELNYILGGGWLCKDSRRQCLHHFR